MRLEHDILVRVDDNDIVDGQFDCPDNVKMIGEGACVNYTGLTHLSIPEGVMIGLIAFSRCTGLTELTFLGKV